MSMAQSSTLRNSVPPFVILFFLVYIFSSDYSMNCFPDFGNYKRIGVVSAEELSLDDPSRRLIIVGDIHGMKSSLDDLLNQVSYNKDKDTLIHLGDITAKGPHSGSLSVLSFLGTHNITGVRGNHDQMVIEWRAWLNWIETLEAGAGSRWLLDLEVKWENANLGGELEDDSDDHKWWSRIPRGWKLFSDHYLIARAIGKSDYDYLLSLPLVLHLPSEHVFLVHAGLLPYDPTLPIASKRQPLAHLPKLPLDVREDSISALRNAQELSILDDIKQNNNPWVLLNIRNLRKDNTVSRKTGKGKPWAEVWDGAMSRCAGFESTVQGTGGSFPCHPSTVIYGHTASRGLDIHRWTMGLDTGCVYGRKLTALVLDSGHSRRGTLLPGAYEGHALGVRDDDDDEDDGGESVKSNPATVPFGDGGQARLVSVECRTPKGQEHRSA
ncbi:Metallo-dependent phosphatase-like protein [Multifurca ochricompacta]|uniref:Metallo-dependent phosphatase-like protein n=1 Tax=Multifurca ochricompacta TaxID=376703 RepID=A0AAD4QQ51_9AGAM|nr:Metallo-dependent phosphatase-like protein [Multifurca ochricompacta]